MRVLTPFRVYSGGKKLPGLVRRRQAEGALFANGKYN
jgi:GH24 family phage-related lysozyme (muramidase)